MAQEAELGLLEEVIVTAQRREENLQTTPVAISAVTGSTIEDNRIFNVYDLASATPSFSLTALTPLDLELNIRGVTNTRLDAPTADPSVGLFVDDVFIGRTGDINVDFYDIERIEIIRGPQGVLLGKNVVGGALSVYTRQPEFERASQVMVSVGNYDSILVNGWTTGALTDELAGRLSFQSRNRDGFAYDLLSGRDLENIESAQVRGQLLYEPKDSDFRARVIFDYNDDSTDGINSVAIADPYEASPSRSSFRPWSGLRAFLGLTDPRVSVPEVSRYAGDDFDSVQYFNRESWGVTLDLEWAFDGFDLTSITGYRDVDSGQMYDQTGAGPDVFDTLADFNDYLAFAAGRDLGLGAVLLFSEPVREDAKIKAFSQEIRLTSNTDSKWDWIVGGYWKHDEVDKFDRFIAESITGALPTLSGESHWDNQGENDSLAVFAQVGYQFNEAWKLTVGGRYTEDDKGGDVQGIQVATGDRFTPGDTAPATPLTRPFLTSYGDTWSEFTPQGILEFQPSEDWYWYGSISTGFKGGGYEDTPANEIAATIPFDPETVTNYEAGFKATLLDGRMRFNATAFFMDYKDLQVQQTNQDCLCNLTDNASDAEIKGLEVEVQWAVGAGVILFAGGSMLDTEYVDFVEASGVDSSGNSLQRTPDNQFNFGVNWTFGTGRLADSLRLNASYYWQDMLYWQPANLNEEDAYGLINARLTYEPPQSVWSVSAWVNNLTDELYRTGVIPFFGEEVSQFGAPRTYGVDLRVNF
ncbi:TonB-dependent receptor [Elongatibacter sediminis]|uniref:TonB-dependent receptor n=1 Tax=Elongatibacter sediminis TaxID=3119006 RepID=A0AAW9R8L8_9GAMM